MADTADTTNYFSVALHDDQDVDSTISDLDHTTPTARERRIAAAVERSKTEYQSHHAYTERKWYDASYTESGGSSSRALADKPKMDRQHLEYLITSLYYNVPPQYTKVLSLVLDAFDPRLKTLGGLTREVVDTGMKAAIACDDKDAAVMLAESTRTLWFVHAGLAATASDCFVCAGRLHDALSPLLAITSGYGLYFHILDRLDTILGKVIDNSGSGSAILFQQAIKAAASRRSPTALPPLFSDITSTPGTLSSEADAILQPDLGDIDSSEVMGMLQLEGVYLPALNGTIRRLQKAMTVKADGGEEQEMARAVREL